VLREDLQRVLARPEYQPRGTDWWQEMQLRALRRLIQWYVETVAPFFAGLYETRPVVLWAICALMGLVLLAVLYHIYLTLRSAFGTGARRRAGGGDLALPQRLGSPAELLQAADEAAAQGQYALAFRWLYLALIRHLDRGAVLRYDHSATNQDYLRQLRPPPDIARFLEPVTRLVEPVWYGYQAAGEVDYRRCREWVMAAWQEGSQDAAS
jgi:hypothetical protein